MGDRSGISRATLESASFKVAGRDEREALARAEDLLLEARRMESVGRLASAVAHDFNNALSVILTYCDLLATEPGSAQNVTADVLEIQKAATRAARLSQQLVNFSRRRTLAPRPIDLTETVLAIEGLIRKAVGEGVDVVLQLERPLPAVVADRLSLEQAILNVVTNAREAMAANGGGVLTIATGTQGAGGGLDPGAGPAVMLAVTDTGQGMDEATLARCFDPFFTTKGPADGAGLGLAMVQGVVRQSRGQVRIQSAPGKGATLQMFFPLA